MNSLKRLSDKELTGRLRQLVSKEQSLTLSILPHLPEVFEMLKDHRLTFSAVIQVYSVLTPENKDTLLPRLVGRSRNKIDKIMADYVPPRKIFDQAKPTIVRKLVVVERAPAGASSKSAAGVLTLAVGEKTRHSDGLKKPNCQDLDN